MILIKSDILDFLNVEDVRSPAKQEEIEMAQEVIKVDLPEQYVNLLLLTNGYEGFIGKSYISLWKIEELVELNDAYGVKEFAPNLVLFGSDGGGEAYAFDASKDMVIINIPFIGLGLEKESILAETFNEFIKNLKVY